MREGKRRESEVRIRLDRRKRERESGEETRENKR